MTTEFSHLAARADEELSKNLNAFADKFDTIKGYSAFCLDSIVRGIERCGAKGADPTLYMLANLGYRAVLLAGMQRLIDAENQAEPTDDEPTLAKIQAAVSSAIEGIRLDQDEFESKIRHELDGIKAKVNRMEANACSA